MPTLTTTQTVKDELNNLDVVLCTIIDQGYLPSYYRQQVPSSLNATTNAEIMISTSRMVNPAIKALRSACPSFDFTRKDDGWTIHVSVKDKTLIDN